MTKILTLVSYVFIGGGELWAVTICTEDWARLFLAGCIILQGYYVAKILS